MGQRKAAMVKKIPVDSLRLLSSNVKSMSVVCFLTGIFECQKSFFHQSVLNLFHQRRSCKIYFVLVTKNCSKSFLLFDIRTYPNLKNAFQFLLPSLVHAKNQHFQSRFSGNVWTKILAASVEASRRLLAIPISAALYLYKFIDVASTNSMRRRRVLLRFHQRSTLLPGK